MLGRLEDPSEEEMEDSFLRYAGNVHASRKESTAYQLSGTLEPDGFLNLTTLMVPVDAVRKCAKEHHVSVTELLAAAMMKAICELQAEQTPRRRHRKPVKVLLPVNLRQMVPQPDAAELRLLWSRRRSIRGSAITRSTRSAAWFTTGWGWRTTRG